MREQRKVVTVLFADVVGSTSFASDSDPEVVRARMTRYFDRITEIAEAHGGTVEKFAGDAAMVVFGVPVAHDDDAERAVRAAIEIRDGATGLAVRIGVNTGEAVTSAREDRQQLVSGDTVNVAARLQQGAETGEIVTGPLTERLTRSVIEYAPREPVVAKGKAEPLVAFRAVRPRSEVPSQARGVPGLSSPLVGRDRELRLLVDTFERVAADSQSHLFTLVGAPGVGKSRLVEEALQAIGTSGGRVTRGRCLPYGRGITYWPLIEMLRADTGVAVTDDRRVAEDKLDRMLSELLPSDDQRAAVRARLTVMMGLEQPAAVMPDTPAERVQREIAWAERKYVEAMARRQPQVMVIDDVQWAEPPMVEILEQLAERVADSALMLICIARPEFLEQHREWTAGKTNSTTITLDSLSAAETGTLISHLLEVEALPVKLRALVVERSAGTPLFCEELIRMLVDDGRLVRDGSRWRATGELDDLPVPPSITAVLSARLDGLPEGDRAVLHAASVIGQRFRADQVAALFGGADVDAYLESLRRKGLVKADDRPDPELEFSHILVRDAAYASLTKSERASLHDRFRGVLEAKAHHLEQLTEIVAHHSERAFSLSAELGLDGEVMQRRARNALDSALALADRGAERSDRMLLDMSLKVAREAAAKTDGTADDELRAMLALLEARRATLVADYPTAQRLSAAAADLAQGAGLGKLVAAARLNQAWTMVWSHGGDVGELQAAVESAIEACHAIGDAEGSIEARFIGSNVQWSIGDLDEFKAMLGTLADEARAIGDRRHLAAILVRLSIAQQVGGDIDDCVATQEEAASIASELGLRDLLLRVQFDRGVRTWTLGEFDLGEERLRQFVADATESGAGQNVIMGLRFLSMKLLRDHRFDEAVGMLDQAIELSHAAGDRWNRAELFAFRVEAACGQGDLVAADRFIGQALEGGREDDLSAMMHVHRSLGLLRWAQGREQEAEAALRLSQRTAASTGFHLDRIHSDLALARFLSSMGSIQEARALHDEARSLNDHAGWRHFDREMEELELELEVQA